MVIVFCFLMLVSFNQLSQLQFYSRPNPCVSFVYSPTRNSCQTTNTVISLATEEMEFLGHNDKHPASSTISRQGYHILEARARLGLYSGVTYVFITSDNDNTNSVKLIIFIEP